MHFKLPVVAIVRTLMSLQALIPRPLPHTPSIITTWHRDTMMTPMMHSNCISTCSTGGTACAVSIPSGARLENVHIGSPTVLTINFQCTNSFEVRDTLGTPRHYRVCVPSKFWEQLQACSFKFSSREAQEKESATDLIHRRLSRLKKQIHDPQALAGPMCLCT